MKSKIEDEFRDSISVKQDFVEHQIDTMLEITRRMIDALKLGHKILLFGNGGSATDASHFAAELVNRFEKDRRALSAIALTTDMSVITSVGNDLDFSQIFSRQIEALGQEGDVAIGLSTSGRSINVLNGIKAAHRQGLVTVGFTGGDGGSLAKEVDHALIVPSKVTARIQESHITAAHVICGRIEDAFTDGKDFGK